jgi:2-polyprenyl-3-methyl-5-hydroxy-6-metoxy-1,4-benzoquinol methylase
MNIDELKRSWSELGRQDPLWAILTSPEKKGRTWRTDEFFEKGDEEIAAVMAYTMSLGIPVERKRALDFGCGVGRLTQALAAHFDHVAGVDITASMLKMARKYNRFGERCRYYLNESDNLHLFPMATLILSTPTLSFNIWSHAIPRAICGNLSEYWRQRVF